jgi:hypothetical protein
LGNENRRGLDGGAEVLALKRRAGTTFVSNNALGFRCVVKRLLAPKKDSSAADSKWQRRLPLLGVVTFAIRPRRAERGWPAAQSFLAGCLLCIGSPGLWQRAGFVKAAVVEDRAANAQRIAIPDAA